METNVNNNVTATPDVQKIESSKPPDTTTVVNTDQQPEDIVARVAKFNSTKSVKVGDEKFNINDLDSIIESVTDVKAKEQFIKMKKSLEKGYQEKFQSLAEEKKKLSTWDINRVKEIVNNPDFVKAAQEYAQMANPSDSGISDEQWSALSEQEKREWANMKQQLDALTNQNVQMQIKQQDEQYKSKYANYDAEKVNQLYNGMLNGTIQATREHFWKVLDYDDAVQRAYELGKQDAQSKVGVKVNNSSMSNNTSTAQDTPPERINGENTESYMRRVFQWRSTLRK